MGWFPLRFGLVVEDKPTEFSCTCTGFHLGLSSRGGGKRNNCRIKGGRGYFKCFIIKKVLVNLEV